MAPNIAFITPEPSFDLPQIEYFRERGACVEVFTAHYPALDALKSRQFELILINPEGIGLTSVEDLCERLQGKSIYPEDPDLERAFKSGDSPKYEDALVTIKRAREEGSPNAATPIIAITQYGNFKMGGMEGVSLQGALLQAGCTECVNPILENDYRKQCEALAKKYLSN